MLVAKNINCFYEKKQILFDVSLHIKEGDIGLLVGTNGSGKSTLFKCFYRLLPFQPVIGASINFNGQDLRLYKTHNLLKSGLVYIPQSGFFYQNLTVKENLEIPLLSINQAERNQKIDEILTIFPMLKSVLFKRAGQVSGGERQLMNLASTILMKPKLVLLDEPFGGLSNKNLDMISGHIVAINRNLNCTILMIEHRINEALPISNRLFGLKLGRLTEIDMEDIEEVKKKITTLLI